jgi:hypothetical protein
VNAIPASALNHREFVALLEETESKHSEIIYHTNVRWLSRRSVVQRLFDLLKEIKLFMTRNNKNIEESINELCTCDLAILVDVINSLEFS